MGAKPLKSRHLVVLFVVFWSATAVIHAFPNKWHIHAVNGLSGGQTLFVHCKSKDDDLGEHNLTVGGDFNWSFRINVWRTTLFWCYMRKPNGQQASFEVFWIEGKSVWLYYRCADGTCIWTAKDDGIYLKDIPVQRDVFVHNWESPGKI